MFRRISIFRSMWIFTTFRKNACSVALLTAKHAFLRRGMHFRSTARTAVAFEVRRRAYLQHLLNTIESLQQEVRATKMGNGIRTSTFNGFWSTMGLHYVRDTFFGQFWSLTEKENTTKKEERGEKW